MLIVIVIAHVVRIASIKQLRYKSVLVAVTHTLSSLSPPFELSRVLQGRYMSIFLTTASQHTTISRLIHSIPSALES